MHLRVPRRLGSFVLVATAALIALGLGGGLTVRYLQQRDLPDQAKRLAQALRIGPGSTVAEIGAGRGMMAVEVARIVGPGGTVIATEMTERQLEDIREAARRAGLTNILTRLAGAHDSNLPARCCDAVYMQRVYHHLTAPASVVASIARALKPDGRLAVIDFEPEWIGSFSTPAGVPDRGGHGVPKQVLLREMKDFGFEATGGIEEFGHDYLAVFRR